MSSVEIFHKSAQVRNGDAPYNDKFGDAASLNDAIAKAREAHREAGGTPENVDNEDVVIVANGENLWVIWEEYAKPHGISWDDFRDSNMHLRDPQNLNGHEQAGWQDWSLVHQGDVVFIPDTPTPQEVADTYAADMETSAGQPDAADTQEAAINQLEADLSLMNAVDQRSTVLAILDNPGLPDEYKQEAVETYLKMFPSEVEQVENAQRLNIGKPGMTTSDGPQYSYPNKDIIADAAQELGITVDLSD
ncbi:MAG: hypothetical protein ACFCUR_03900 [Rhodomicrobiaceae bacterium]